MFSKLSCSYAPLAKNAATAAASSASATTARARTAALIAALARAVRRLRGDELIGLVHLHGDLALFAGCDTEAELGQRSGAAAADRHVAGLPRVPARAAALARHDLVAQLGARRCGDGGGERNTAVA